MRSDQTFDFPARIRRAVLRMRIVLIAAAALAAGPAFAVETQQGETVNATGAKTDMVLLAGQDIHVGGVASTHDVFAAGRVIRVDQTSADHLITAGETLAVTGSDVRGVIAAGRDLSFETGQARDGVVAFGQTLRFRPTFKISGSAIMAGETVEVQAPVGGDLYASGRVVTIDSPVGGNARLQATRVVIGPNARITGDLAYRADQIDISPQAVISGQRTILPPEKTWKGWKNGWRHRERTLEDRIRGDLFGAAAFCVLALGLAALVPGLMARAGGMVGRNPVIAGVVGLLALVVGPAIALVLLITLVGAPLALAVILLWAALLVMSATAAAAGLGLSIRRLARRSAAAEAPGLTGLLGWILLGALVLCVLGAIPFVGGWIWALACLLGAGAIAAQGHAVLAARA
jgi:hypothetical protein